MITMGEISNAEFSPSPLEDLASSKKSSVESVGSVGLVSPLDNEPVSPLNKQPQLEMKPLSQPNVSKINRYQVSDDEEELI